MTNYKISFCTVAMNRAHHIKKTLIYNINANSEYKNLEFILLDYNSDDDLETYVKRYLKKYIDSGKLIYYKAFKHEYFHRSHSRNVAFKLCTGDIICNIDADNFAGKNFAKYVNSVFENNRNVFLSTIHYSDTFDYTKRDSAGRICLSKIDLVKTQGFDERMSDYGFEDYDFVNRLELNGGVKLLIKQSKFLNVITHSHVGRITNEAGYKNIDSLLIRYINDHRSEVIFLFKNGLFNQYIINSGHSSAHDPDRVYSNLRNEFKIEKDSLLAGNWEYSQNNITIYSNNGKISTLVKIDKLIYRVFNNRKTDFMRIDYPQFLEHAIFTHSQLYNKIIMTDNTDKNIIKVNNSGFGNDTVYKNFDYSNPITT